MCCGAWATRHGRTNASSSRSRIVVDTSLPCEGLACSYACSLAPEADRKARSTCAGPQVKDLLTCTSLELLPNSRRHYSRARIKLSACCGAHSLVELSCQRTRQSLESALKSAAFCSQESPSASSASRSKALHSSAAFCASGSSSFARPVQDCEQKP